MRRAPPPAARLHVDGCPFAVEHRRGTRGYAGVMGEGKPPCAGSGAPRAFRHNRPVFPPHRRNGHRASSEQSSFGRKCGAQTSRRSRGGVGMWSSATTAGVSPRPCGCRPPAAKPCSAPSPLASEKGPLVRPPPVRLVRNPHRRMEEQNEILTPNTHGRRVAIHPARWKYCAAPRSNPTMPTGDGRDGLEHHAFRARSPPGHKPGQPEEPPCRRPSRAPSTIVRRILGLRRFSRPELGVLSRQTLMDGA